MLDKIKVGSKLEGFIRKNWRQRWSDCFANKSSKLKGWKELEKAYESNETIMGKITSKCKGGVIVEHIDTGSLMFCPGSQISDKPIKILHI